MARGWDQDEDAIVIDLWGQGWSCAQIALKLVNRSRNSVIGRARRLGLPERDGGRPNSGPKRKAVRKIPNHVPMRRKSPFHFGPTTEPKADLSFTPRAAAVMPLMIAFGDLADNQCRFAYGDEAPYLFCGHVQQEGSAYCKNHHALCWIKAPQPSPREQRRAA